MIRTVEIAWLSPCKTAHVEIRNGLYWCYIGSDHVGTQFFLDEAVKLLMRKLGEANGAGQSARGDPHQE